MLALRALVLAMLVLPPSGCALAGRSLGGYVDDKLMERGVTRGLASEGPGAKGVDVDIFGGTAYLSGTVDTAKEKSDAEIVAWQVEGVRQVVNDIVAGPPPVAAAALPDFRLPHPLTERLPGVERVEPGRDGGPDLAYDHRGRVVASVHTVVWRTDNPGTAFDHGVNNIFQGAVHHRRAVHGILKVFALVATRP